MTSTFLIFGSVFLAVFAAGFLVDRWQRRRGWQETARTVASLVGERQQADGGTPHPILKAAPRGGVLQRLAVARSLTRTIEQAAVSYGPAGFVLRATLSGAVVATLLVLVSGGALLALPGFAAGAALPYLVLRRSRRVRMGRFEEQFPEAVDLLARAIRAGHPFTAGLKMVAEESAEPVAGEFRRVFDEQKFGLPVQDSLQGLADRVELVDVQIFVTAVSIQREVGGNLAEILDQISFTVRERFKIQRQVGVYTAQGRMTGILLALLPVALGLLLTAINPQYMGALLTDPLGKVMLGAAAVMQLTGYGIIRRITAIQV